MSQVMFLTGCGSGIGRHLAAALLRRGHRVVATDVNEPGMQLGSLAPESLSAEESARLLRLHLDVRSAQGWERALDLAEQRCGPVDVLLNIAGVLRPGYLHETSAADIDLHLDVNCKGCALGMAAVARRMLPRRRGHIINIGSLASLVPVSGLGLYSASKFALRGLSLAAAQDLRPHGVQVSLIMPDAVQTPMLDLQVDYPQAALTFSGDRALTVADIEAVVERVLRDRPLELAVPRGRGLLARLANSLPNLALLLAPGLLRKGQRRQQALRQRMRETPSE